jgi:acyl-CoA hydrolase
MPTPKIFHRIVDAADWALREVGPTVSMATPLGLGKPNDLINEIYKRIKGDPQRELRIFTALSLHPPALGTGLQKRLLGPFRDRQWGADYPCLEYIKDLERGGLPRNIRVHEFYVQAGKSLHFAEVQRDYVSVNYTHAPYAIVEQDVNILVQLVAKNPRKPGLYSLSCNPDLTFDVVDIYKKLGKKMLVVGVVHPDLPYCGADAEVAETFFDAIVDSPEVKHKLFALPRQPIADADYVIGLQASLLIEDGGTLQIGIGSLSEAVVYCTLLRHQSPEIYRELTAKLLTARPFAGSVGKFHQGSFTEGLYGTSEMVMDGFMHLHRGGVLKREVFDIERSVRRYLHGAFFLGSNEFYEWVRERDSNGDTGFCMTRVSKVNDLYDENELAVRRQRVKARFFNSCMSVTLLGGVASDTLEDGQVVSGVGGQYNFVAMSHELPDSHSVLMLRSTRPEGSTLRSNFLWSRSHLTIPRHLRDVVISEYGVAFLKNKTDESVIQAQLCITDSRFQVELREQAVQARKLSPEWKLPRWALNNHAQWPGELLTEGKRQGLFPEFPFGSDFTPVEEQLVGALTRLKRASHSKIAIAQMFWAGATRDAGPFREALERMGLVRPQGLRERAERALLLGAL